MQWVRNASVMMNTVGTKWITMQCVLNASGVMNAVGKECITPGLLRMMNAVRAECSWGDECSGYRMHHTLVTEDDECSACGMLLG